jgi:UDP-N-acetylmuramate dehydrogenase
VTGHTARFRDAFIARFGADRLGTVVPLAPMTTFKVGGPADWFFESRTGDELADALVLAESEDVPVTVLGGGSNVLIADAGIRGLVIRPRGGAISRIDEMTVRADAAITINGLVRWTIMNGAAGLEAWAGTPGTVGGAIHGNAHYGGVLISELVQSVQLVDRDGKVSNVPAAEMGFAYDRSRLQTSGEIVLSADFFASAGEPAALRETARRSLAYRKKTQPLETPSAGCVFQNPQPERDTVPDGVPWSAGALVDRAGLKGMTLGGAMVSTAHGNFIVNGGGATAHDIRGLIERCRRRVLQEFGVALREEIVYLGEFDVITAD